MSKPLFDWGEKKGKNEGNLTDGGKSHIGRILNLSDLTKLGKSVHCFLIGTKIRAKEMKMADWAQGSEFYIAS